MPLKLVYADEVVFLGKDDQKLKHILPVATSVVNELSFKVNEEKTEYVKVLIAGIDKTSSNGAKIDRNKPLRFSKLFAGPSHAV